MKILLLLFGTFMTLSSCIKNPFNLQGAAGDIEKSISNSPSPTPPTFNTKAGSWSYLGDLGMAAPGLTGSILKSDANGVPFLFYRGTGGYGSMKKYVAGAWAQVGSVDFTPTMLSGLFDMAFDSNGYPFVVYADSAHSNRGTVMHFDGTSWAVVGTLGFTDAFSSSLFIAVDLTNDTPYVSYSGPVGACGGSGGIYVDYFDGGSWVKLGGSSCLSTSTFVQGLVVDSHHHIYVSVDAFVEGDYFEFDGTAWNTLPALVFSGNYPLALDQNENVYTASFTSIYKLSGGSWVAPYPNFAASETIQSLLWATRSGNEKLFVLYADADSDLRVARMGNTAWDIYSNQSFPTRASASLMVDASGIPVLSFQEIPLIDVVAYTFAETASRSALDLHWQQTNPSGSTSLRALWTVSNAADLNDQKIQIYTSENCQNPNGAPIDLSSAVTNHYDIVGSSGAFVTYRIQSLFNSGETDWSECSSLMGVSSIWNYAGDAGSFTDSGLLAHLASDTTGKIYSAYTARNLQGEVKVWDGSTWTLLGGAAFSAGEKVYNFEITIAPVAAPLTGGHVFVVYADSVTHKLSVRTWDGTAWSLIGDAHFTATSNPSHLGITVTPSGQPFISYVEAGSFYVMSYNLISGWSVVGGAPVDSSYASVGSLFSDTSGVVYVSYKDPSTQKGVVKKFDGTNWVALGSETANDVYIYSAKFNPIDGGIYAAFEDAGNGYKATMLKWDGTSWSTVGTAGFSALGSVQNIDFDFDSAGKPTIVFTPWSGTYSIVVMHFDGTNWGNVGNTGFTNGPDSSLSIAVDRAHDQTYVHSIDLKLKHEVRRYDP